jgi:hypothetical protein
MFATFRLRSTATVLAIAVLAVACGESTSDVTSSEPSGAEETSEETTPMTDAESTSSSSSSSTPGEDPEDETADDLADSSTTTSAALFTTTSADKSTPSSEESTTTTSVDAITTSTSTSTTTSSSSTTAPEEPGDTADDVDYDPGLKPLVDQARADLANRLGIGEDQIALTLAEARTWPNSANGCPVDGMQYLQVLTDGAELIFSAGGATYRYTTGGRIFTPQLCEN